MPLSTDPVDLLLDSTNDLVVTDDLQFSTGIAAVTQACRIALQMFQDEWFLNLDAGIPYWDEILAKKPAVATVAARVAFDAELRAIDGVVDVLKLDVSFDGVTRTLSIEWQVRTAFGDTPTDTIVIAIGGI